MTYTAIFDQILDSSLADQWQARVLFQDLLLLADSEGIVDITVNAVQRRTNLPMEVVNQGLEALLEPDPMSRSSDEEGRRLVLLDPERSWGWRIVNHEKYEQLRRQIDKRERDRKRKRQKPAVDDNGADVGVAEIPPLSPPVADVPRSSRSAEMDWRVEQTWQAHLEARGRFFKNGADGKPGRAPKLTAEIRKEISRSLKEHDGALLKPEQRQEWLKDSKTLAAGQGIFLSPHHVGKNDSGTKYLEPWRPWKHQRGKGDPVERFAECFHHPPKPQSTKPRRQASGSLHPDTVEERRRTIGDF